MFKTILHRWANVRAECNMINIQLVIIKEKHAKISNLDLAANGPVDILQHKQLHASSLECDPCNFQQPSGAKWYTDAAIKLWTATAFLRIDYQVKRATRTLSPYKWRSLYTWSKTQNTCNTLSTNDTKETCTTACKLYTKNEVTLKATYQ